ncbi:nitrile hydratase subunit alpha [Lentibacter algarum]|uniref:nitrile hydratase subunit alpha n=1 Tax=Lentibacter algarum TaxID=576131 RepID=UPI001C0760DA|nr:nitrile hydratase subunit alpha [Lentibacter algarum]MBU2982008.1 nitrile hydratase subunit alpha [Lentibacter algarum]
MPHDHPHDHPVSRDHSEPRPAFAALLDQVLKVLDDKDILTTAQVTAQIEDMDGRTPTEGAKIIARCWDDPDYLDLARTDLQAAAGQVGIAMPAYPKFVLLDNTGDVHHVVVCTLCSCYPRPILGPPPVWYKSRNYRARVVVEPRDVLAEFGTTVPQDKKLQVVDSTADCRYLVLPERPAGSDGMTQEQLAGLVTRDSMIGVTRLNVPVT